MSGVSGSRVHSGYWHAIFLSVPPIVHWSSWLCSFRHLSPHHTYTDSALYVHIRCSLHNHIPQRSVYIHPALCSLSWDAAVHVRHGRYRTVHLQRSLSSCCNIYWYLLNKRVFFAFHDPAVLYNWIFHSVLNKADFFHYSTRCPQLLLPEYSRKHSYVFQGPGSGYYNRCGRCLHIHVR